MFGKYNLPSPWRFEKIICKNSFKRLRHLVLHEDLRSILEMNFLFLNSHCYLITWDISLLSVYFAPRSATISPHKTHLTTSNSKTYLLFPSAWLPCSPSTCLVTPSRFCLCLCICLDCLLYPLPIYSYSLRTDSCISIQHTFIKCLPCVRPVLSNGI